MFAAAVAVVVAEVLAVVADAVGVKDWRIQVHWKAVEPMLRRPTFVVAYDIIRSKKSGRMKMRTKHDFFGRSGSLQSRRGSGRKRNRGCMDVIRQYNRGGTVEANKRNMTSSGQSDCGTEMRGD